MNEFRAVLSKNCPVKNLEMMKLAMIKINITIQVSFRSKRLGVK